MSDCIFCKLANKEIPTEFLYEDENVVAFNDLNPLTPVHVLVVPKSHYDNIIDGIPAVTLESVTKAIAAVTEKTGIRRLDSVLLPTLESMVVRQSITFTSTF